MIFVYDKNNDLEVVARFNKKDLATLYVTKDKQLISIDLFKEKNKLCARRVVVNFEENVKLWFSPLEGYEYSLRAISKDSTQIKFPKQVSRIETDLNGLPRSFTIQSDVMDRLINRI